MIAAFIAGFVLVLGSERVLADRALEVSGLEQRIKGLVEQIHETEIEYARLEALSEELTRQLQILDYRFQTEGEEWRDERDTQWARVRDVLLLMERAQDRSSDLHERLRQARAELYHVLLDWSEEHVMAAEQAVLRREPQSYAVHLEDSERLLEEAEKVRRERGAPVIPTHTLVDPPYLDNPGEMIEWAGFFELLAGSLEAQIGDMSRELDMLIHERDVIRLIEDAATGRVDNEGNPVPAADDTLRARLQEIEQWILRLELARAQFSEYRELYRSHAHEFRQQALRGGG